MLLTNTSIFNRSVMIENMLSDLENSIDCKDMAFQSDCLLLGVHSKVYQRLMKRPTCGWYLNTIIFFKSQRK